MRALVVNEFSSSQWNDPQGNTTLGIAVMESRSFYTNYFWAWVGLGAIAFFVVLFNCGLVLAFHLNRTSSYLLCVHACMHVCGSHGWLNGCMGGMAGLLCRWGQIVQSMYRRAVSAQTTRAPAVVWTEDS
jgi:Plant PDR ABC transporter associated